MKVLLVDYTALRGLMSTVPDYIQGEVTKYQGIFYLGDPKIGEVQQLIQKGDYDFILMDFDYSCGRRDIFLCEHIVFLTDIQRHHLDVLEGMRMPHTMNKYLIFHMESWNRKTLTYLKQVAENMGVPREHLLAIPWGERERQNQLRCQYRYEIPWRKVSSSMKKVMVSLVQDWMDYPGREIEMAVSYHSEQVGC